MKPSPRLEVNLAKLHHNASHLVRTFGSRGVSVLGVCKLTQGSQEVANTLLDAGVCALGDSHIEHIESLRRAGVVAEMTLLRSPMRSQIQRVVASADVSYNTEIGVIRGLSHEALRTQRRHGVVLMVELGDLREGIMPADLLPVVQETLALPNVYLRGIGTNLACRSGVSPDAHNMAALSELADTIEQAHGIQLDTISGGNSANVLWGLGGHALGRINHLRLGEVLLLGCEPLHRHTVDGLYTDVFGLVAEVIESKRKPSVPWGTLAQTAFGVVPVCQDQGWVMQTILAVGRQDIDPMGLCAPQGMTIVGASSDHLVVVTHGKALNIGDEVAFGLNYSALLVAMTSPLVAKVVVSDNSADWHFLH